MEPSRAVGAHRGPSGRGVRVGSSRPDSSQTPSAISTTPTTTVAYGRYRCTVVAADMVSAPNTPNTVRKPNAIPTVAASARPAAATPDDAARAFAAHHEQQVGGQHGKPTRVQRGHQSGGEGQADQTLVHRSQDLRAETRSESSCCDIAEVGLLTNVELPSAR